MRDFLDGIFAENYVGEIPIYLCMPLS